MPIDEPRTKFEINRMIGYHPPRIFCPLCGGGEWEEIETPNPNTEPYFICKVCKI